MVMFGIDANMHVDLTEDGISDTYGRAIRWRDLAQVTAEFSGHAVARRMLVFRSFDGVVLDVVAGESGWDELVEHLVDHIPLRLPNLADDFPRSLTQELTLYLRLRPPG
ncbi:hypothetical protein [Microbacterium gorillae]|uniref:hypothetical protein n=1 Tax=Microbacterium gorillae TaxID=1231063 RepID=UPI00058B3740|nr:hypothetical protein [Microbacterium gorillae]